MPDHRVCVPIKAWFGDEELALEFPEGWAVHECRMKGHGAPAIGADALREAIEHPIGSPPLSKVAAGKKRVAIVFDDFTRPTPAADIVPVVLEVLFSAGIRREQIRFIAALGTHRAMTRHEWASKLGEDIVLDYPVYNHNAWEHLVDMGKSAGGTPILVNRECASCDLRIGIGSLIPHPEAGFSGGLKIVFPGVMGIKSINHNHMHVMPRNPDGTMSEFYFGHVYDNPLRDDIHEVAQRIGLDFKVDVLVNEKREVVRVYAGDGLESFYEGVRYAKTFYATDPCLGADVTVVNTFPIEDEASKSLWASYLSTRPDGDAVMLCHTPDGQMHHFGNTRFGTDYGGAQYMTARRPPIPQFKRTLIVDPYHARTDTEYFGRVEQCQVHRSWSAARAELEAEHGAGTTVAVYPYASIQCPPFGEDL